MIEEGYGSLRVAGQAEIGENASFDRNSLSGYVCETRLKRVFNEQADYIREFILSKLKIASPIRIRLEDSKDDGGKAQYEEFDVVEILCMKMTDFKSKLCKKFYGIWEDKGLDSVIKAIHYTSPINRI